MALCGLGEKPGQTGDLYGSTIEDIECAINFVDCPDFAFSEEEDGEYGYSRRELKARYPRLETHDLVILGEGPAPMDGAGFCIVKVEDPHHPYLDGPVENRKPKTWSNPKMLDADMDDDLYILDKPPRRKKQPPLERTSGDQPA